jgi:rhodanese-related sulfurtransferase
MHTGFSPLATPAQVQAALVAEHGISGNGVIAESIIEERARNGVVILDVRTLEEWNEGHVKGAKHVPIDELRGHVMVLAEETAGKAIFVHCKGGYRGHLALRILKEHGFQVCSVKTGGRGEGYVRLHV